MSTAANTALASRLACPPFGRTWTAPALRFVLGARMKRKIASTGEGK